MKIEIILTLNIKKNKTIVTFSVCDIFVEIAGCDVDNGVGIGYYKTNTCFKTQN